ncbi:MAG: helix-turn-helix domain-containing protein [Acidimicrobiia bacterium]
MSDARKGARQRISPRDAVPRRSVTPSNDRSPSAASIRALLSPADLADYLGVPVATVYRWRSQRERPAGMRVGRHVRYRLVDVENWLDSLRREGAGCGSRSIVTGRP